MKQDQLGEREAPKARLVERERKPAEAVPARRA